ncbi:hypothetical protein Psal071_00861 [Piscirickettsia salmonis]|uniref:Uncharacterized protein n=1 Tax=Piscirickettsia salmonis TaxID=1238 RepID=A0A9Q6PRX3_PISSA|nr:hypothetical protein [Piscirickettsia salmonis]QGN95819.1 hypothetical protein Psal006a_02443 [Piscirickettsia salmonis]QGO05230.1 hypothetical protein Psal009_01115 [Piscirickettsia salmonis]QGO33551.1 hypothetical protein Psal028_00862 [Piscirickettsia salmonis]QGO37163.1 hypothetical protein Psal040_00862 [Piscirickettsia salmonis]QGO40787.1 hypothetical protein Psal041_00861 [Piscirickettsia salmonis]
MPIPHSSEVQYQCLIFLKEACLDFNESLVCRESIHCQDQVVDCDKVQPHLLDVNIESKFQNLLSELQQCSTTVEEENNCYRKFEEFFLKKTNYTLDIRRVLAFFKNTHFPIHTLHQTLLLEAIHFNTVAKLTTFFNPALIDAANSESEDSLCKVLQNQFREATISHLSKLNFSYHPKAFKQLDKIGLGKLSSCIQEVLEKPQRFKSYHLTLKDVSDELQQICKNIQPHLSAQNLSADSNSFLSLFRCFNPKAIDLEACFNQYQLASMQAVFNYAMSEEQSIEQLESQLSQHEIELLSTSNLKINYPDFQSPCARLLSKINIQANQSPSSQLLFTYQQQAETPDFAIAERKTYIPLPK